MFLNFCLCGIWSKQRFGTERERESANEREVGGEGLESRSWSRMVEKRKRIEGEFRRRREVLVVVVHLHVFISFCRTKTKHTEENHPLTRCVQPGPVADVGDCGILLGCGNSLASAVESP